MKKGILLNNTLTAVIAVAGLVILYFFASKLYTNITQNQEMKNGQKTINYLEGKINALQEGENTSYTIQGFKVDKGAWYLLGWDNRKRDRPGACAIESCVCICKTEKDVSSLDEESINVLFVDACQDNGFCRKVGNRPVEVGTYSETFSPGLEGHMAVSRVVKKYVKLPIEGLLMSVEIQKFKSYKQEDNNFPDFYPQQVDPFPDWSKIENRSLLIWHDETKVIHG
jgi:hypothetical protein